MAKTKDYILLNNAIACNLRLYKLMGIVNIAQSFMASMLCDLGQFYDFYVREYPNQYRKHYIRTLYE